MAASLVECLQPLKVLTVASGGGRVMAETKDLHIEVKDMPIREDRIINMLAYMRGVNKSDVLRVAIIEYANTHLKEIQEGFPPERGKKRGEGGY